MTRTSHPGTAELRDRVRDFIRTVVMPAEPVPGAGLDPAVRAELQSRAKSAGVFAPLMSRELGGQGLPLTEWSPILQEAGYSPIGPTALNCMAPDEGNMHLLDLIADDEQRARYLEPLADGRVRSCFAMSEPHPGAGSDPSALRTTARQVDGGWIVDGEKRFISGADGAGIVIVIARNEGTQEGRVVSTMFIADMSTPGIRLGRAIRTVDRMIEGGHAHLHFEDCFLPDSAVLGAPGAGFEYAQLRLAPARLTHCMRWLGLSRRALDCALDRVNHRQVFGARLADLGIAQEMIAQSVIDLETSDALIAKTVELLVSDPRAGTALSSVAKVHCSEAVFRIIDRAVQLCGGDGVSDELPLGSWLNEVRPFRIYDGANEAHKWGIARRAAIMRGREVDSGAPRLDVVAPAGTR